MESEQEYYLTSSESVSLRIAELKSEVAEAETAKQNAWEKKQRDAEIERLAKKKQDFKKLYNLNSALLFVILFAFATMFLQNIEPKWTFLNSTSFIGSLILFYAIRVHVANVKLSFSYDGPILIYAANIFGIIAVLVRPHAYYILPGLYGGMTSAVPMFIFLFLAEFSLILAACITLNLMLYLRNERLPEGSPKLSAIKGKIFVIGLGIVMTLLVIWAILSWSNLLKKANNQAGITLQTKIELTLSNSGYEKDDIGYPMNAGFYGENIAEQNASDFGKTLAQQGLGKDVTVTAKGAEIQAIKGPTGEMVLYKIVNPVLINEALGYNAVSKSQVGDWLLLLPTQKAESEVTSKMKDPFTQAAGNFDTTVALRNLNSADYIKVLTQENYQSQLQNALENYDKIWYSKNS
ncbi:MAG: hypothetical protein LBI11_01485 [Streptococcaceae bacterium]|jgi:hypothetical protein|nr:hypothetical protein [Streptococcaceae bacterium]